MNAHLGSPALHAPQEGPGDDRDAPGPLPPLGFLREIGRIAIELARPSAVGGGCAFAVVEWHTGSAEIVLASGTLAAASGCHVMLDAGWTAQLRFAGRPVESAGEGAREGLIGAACIGQRIGSGREAAGALLIATRAAAAQPASDFGGFARAARIASAVYLKWRNDRDLLRRTLRNAESARRSPPAGAHDATAALSAELHDGVIQNLAAARMQAESLAQLCQSGPSPVQQAAQRTLALLRQSLAELRTLAERLQPRPGPDAPLSQQSMAVLGVEQLRTQTMQAALRSVVGALVPQGIEFDVDTATLPRLGLPAELTVLRVCQEAVSNAVRHGRPSRVSIRGGVDGDRAWLIVIDNGCGMPAPQSRPGGLGVRSMESRMRAIGGGCLVLSHPGRGTTVNLSIRLAGARITDSA